MSKETFVLFCISSFPLVYAKIELLNTPFVNLATALLSVEVSIVNLA